jgi:hypothetical protein
MSTLVLLTHAILGGLRSTVRQITTRLIHALIPTSSTKPPPPPQASPASTLAAS